ncbi:MAG: DHA2 family efflux MFS transporter permease subunit [Alicyclobacillus shizuokensis]|nr:DHA2 family efflux MFS transporter permease subunit [Alicyclobacillus shizuokensis]
MMGDSAGKWFALAALSLSILAVTLDGTVLNLALPTLAKAFRASESDLEWFSAAYLLMLAAAVLPVGFIGDRFGRKKIMLASLVLFGVGSAACAYSHSTGVFIAARVLLGVAGAGVTVMAMSALTVLFNEQERPKAVGIYEAANFLGLPLGPILGGWMLTHFWWGWMFLINVPVILVACLVVAPLVPESRAAAKPKLDAIGVASSTVGLVALTYGLIEAGDNGWGNAKALLFIGIGLVVLVGFTLWEQRQGARPGKEPLIHLSLFQSRSFAFGALLSAVPGLALIGVLFTTPQYFQGVLGTSTMGSGWRLLPLIGGLIAGAVPAGQINRVGGDKIATSLGYVVACAGFIIGATTHIDSSVGFSAVWMALVGFGVGLTLATATSAALSRLSHEDSGIGTAVVQLLQKVSAPFGTAIMGSVLSNSYQSHLILSGLPSQEVQAVRRSIFAGLAVARSIGSTSLEQSIRHAFVRGMDTSLLVSMGISILGLILTVVFLPGRKRENEAMKY